MMVRCPCAKRLIRTLSTSTDTNRKMLGMIVALLPRLRISSEMNRWDACSRRGVVANTPYGASCRSTCSSRKSTSCSWPGHDLANDLVGGVLEAEDLAGVVLLDVEDAEVLGVRGKAAEPLHRVDVLGADRRAHDHEGLCPAVQDHLDVIARLQVVRTGEGLADDDLLVAVVREARTSNQVHPVDDAVEAPRPGR